MSDTDSAVIWRFIDGKPGHENQSAGLTDALGRLTNITVHDIDVTRGRPAAANLADLPAPVLLIGAGRATHGPMLAAKARYGGRAIVLMRPQRRLAEFDLCLIPVHDEPLASANVLVTEGALNRVRPAASRTANAGLLLIGGPSRHHDWLDREIIGQVAAIVQRESATDWTLCDSRRTPARFRALLEDEVPDLPYIHFADVAPGWLAERMGHTPTIWVSEDSVSMVYEALSAGASVGILAVPRRRASRVIAGAAGLMARGLTTPFLVWSGGGALPAPAAPLAEADRAADRIVKQWLSGR